MLKEIHHTLGDIYSNKLKKKKEYKLQIYFTLGSIKYTSNKKKHIKSRTCCGYA